MTGPPQAAGQVPAAYDRLQRTYNAVADLQTRLHRVVTDPDRMTSLRVWNEYVGIGKYAAAQARLGTIAMATDDVALADAIRGSHVLPALADMNIALGRTAGTVERILDRPVGLDEIAKRAMLAADHAGSVLDELSRLGRFVR